MEYLGSSEQLGKIFCVYDYLLLWVPLEQGSSLLITFVSLEPSSVCWIFRLTVTSILAVRAIYQKSLLCPILLNLITRQLQWLGWWSLMNVLRRWTLAFYFFNFEKLEMKWAQIWDSPGRFQFCYGAGGCRGCCWGSGQTPRYLVLTIIFCAHASKSLYLPLSSEHCPWLLKPVTSWCRSMK